MSRQLLAWKRAPHVEMTFDNLGVLIEDNRVRLILHGSDLEALESLFSWDEWRDLAARVEHSIEWIKENTPEDVDGVSFMVNE